MNDIWPQLTTEAALHSRLFAAVASTSYSVRRLYTIIRLDGEQIHSTQFGQLELKTLSWSAEAEDGGPMRACTSRMVPFNQSAFNSYKLVVIGYSTDPIQSEPLLIPSQRFIVCTWWENECHNILDGRAGMCIYAWHNWFCSKWLHTHYSPA